MAADCAGHEDAIAPHDRAGMRETRNGDFPFDVLARRTIPRIRKLLTIGNARCRWSAEARPTIAIGRFELWHNERYADDDGNQPERGRHIFSAMPTSAAIWAR